MLKKLSIISGVLILSILLLFFTSWNNFIFNSINVDEVIAINIKIENLFDRDIESHIDDSESFSQILSIEDLMRKNDGTNFLIKAKPWYIEIEYTLSNGKKEIRKYKGQKIFVELQENFIKIPQINKSVIE